MPAIDHPLTLTGVSLRWPDDTVLFEDLDLAIPPGRTGIVGSNGSGKSSLLRLLAGDLAPSAGTVTAARLGHLPQDLTLDTTGTVAGHLGVSDVLTAIERIEAGETDPALFDTVGDDGWDLRERATAELTRLGLPDDILERRLVELSGGEVIQLGLAHLLLQRPDVLLLDEPTNNLDADARDRLIGAVSGFRGAVVVVSHDRELLDRMDRIIEVRGGRVRFFGGGHREYAAQIEAEQQAAQQAAATARNDLRRQHREAAEAEQKLAQRRRTARRAESSGIGKAEINYFRNRADRSSATVRSVHADRLDSARERLDQAEEHLRDDTSIRVELPATAVPAGRRVLDCEALVLRTHVGVDLTIVGPESVGLVGPNGVGKSTLLHTIVGDLRPLSGTVRQHVPTALLPQRLDLLDPAGSILTNVSAHAPQGNPQRIRSELARFGFRGSAVEQSVGTLSGGQRFRAALATLLLADPAPQLFLLDEPTNNLDFASYDALVEALRAHRGALLVVSHDRQFLAEIGVGRMITMGDDGSSSTDWGQRD